MVARDAEKCLSEITRNHCPTSTKCAINRAVTTEVPGQVLFTTVSFVHYQGP
ncbi:hypothetical protein DSM14862_03271 (plasmid) [Sulfitobacter indolifex]|nr:hypothetical protein DSM14862_03271 [Sulfitobacter indolifex]